MRLGEAASLSAENVAREVAEAADGFPKLAEPVRRSIAAYMPPVKTKFDETFDKLTKAVEATRTRVDNVLAGTGGNTGGAPKEGAPPPPKPPPTMAPNEFIKMAAATIAAPKTDEKIAELEQRSTQEVPNILMDKSHTVYNALSALSTNVETVMSALRSITARQGTAIEVDYQSTFGIEIEFHIHLELPKTFSAPSTNRLNVEAAINYLHGNNAEAALAELKAAVNYWNDNARVQAVQRSLSPAQMLELDELNRTTGGDLDDVRNDLGEATGRIYDALHAGKIGEANALRLRSGIDDDRKKRGDEGADAVVDRIIATGDTPATIRSPGLTRSTSKRPRWCRRVPATAGCRRSSRSLGLEGAPETEIAKDLAPRSTATPPRSATTSSSSRTIIPRRAATM